MCLAIPGKIVSIEPRSEESMRIGKIDFGGIKKKVNLELVPEAETGDYVLVHVGVAISKVDEKEANKIFEFLEAMEELDDLKIDESLKKDNSGMPV